MSEQKDDYETIVGRSLDLKQLRQVIETMEGIATVSGIWDGEIVVAGTNLILGTLWYSTDIEEWMYDPKRFGEQV